MSTAERIQAILDAEVSIPRKDAAGIITPEGIDCGVKIKTLETCLAIARQEEQKLSIKLPH